MPIKTKNDKDFTIKIKKAPFKFNPNDPAVLKEDERVRRHLAGLDIDSQLARIKREEDAKKAGE